MRRPLNSFTIALVAFAAGLCACGGSQGGRPNVLVISLDSVRRDALSTYGRQPARAPDTPTTPNIDRLAAAGVVMEDAYTTTSWTLRRGLSNAKTAPAPSQPTPSTTSHAVASGGSP